MLKSGNLLNTSKSIIVKLPSPGPSSTILNFFGFSIFADNLPLSTVARLFLAIPIRTESVEKVYRERVNAVYKRSERQENTR